MMFPESFLTKIFERPDVCMIPMQYQSAMIQAIGEVLDEEVQTAYSTVKAVESLLLEVLRISVRHVFL